MRGRRGRERGAERERGGGGRERVRGGNQKSRSRSDTHLHHDVFIFERRLVSGTVDYRRFGNLLPAKLFVKGWNPSFEKEMRYIGVFLQSRL